MLACVSFTNCDSCLNAKIAFDCKWCDSVGRCSDGFDRHRQDWLSRKCDSDAQSKETPNKCKIPPPMINNNNSSNGVTNYNTGGSPFNPSSSSSNINPGAPWSSQGPGSSASSSYAKGTREEKEPKENASSSKAGALFFLIMIAMITGAGFWVFYAYKHPTTGAGQFLIKYRPAEWRWNNGPETRYTAASIHM